MSLSALLRHAVTWERPLVSADSSRGTTRDYRPVRQGVPCLVQPVTARERMLFAQRAVDFTHRIYFDAVLDMAAGDRLRLTSAPGPVLSGGLTVAKYYIVTGWRDQGGQGGRCFVVDAREQSY